MRDLKFRAKKLGSGELTYFGLMDLHTKDGILYAHCVGIDPDTIQQYIGFGKLGYTPKTRMVSTEYWPVTGR